ncbi:MAG: hypothetical protein K2Y39_04190 [Candidatus Obscuribacterales bacterium]|nr:hypothetical protein [Candidatus Obscuribacterales bacterium]
MNPDSIRRNNVIDLIMRAAFAGVPWQSEFSLLMTEFNISEQDVERVIAKTGAVGMAGVTPEEVEGLEAYIGKWIEAVSTALTGSNKATDIERLSSQLRPLVDSLYRDLFKITTPPKIVLCESPAKLAIYLKLFSELRGDSADFSAEQFRTLAQEVVKDYTPEEKDEFSGPHEREFVLLAETDGALVAGKSLTYQLLEHVLQEFAAELITETSSILGCDAGEFFSDSIYFRFEPIRRRLSSFFDIDLHFALSDADLWELGFERMSAHYNAFNKDTWGLWQVGHFLMGGGFMMDCLSARGKYSESVQKELRLWLEMFRLAPWFSFFEGVCLVGMYPAEIFLDGQLRLNNRSGAAVTFADNWKIWAMEGSRVPRRLIEDPQSLTVEDIREAANVNIRRIMIDMYGPSRFLKDSGSEMIHKDEYGELYQQDIPGDEPLTMVCVTNSTMESDGTFRRYFLRVPPHMRTAQEAVAWTFGMDQREYHPEIET